jgi:uncharacterized damage-inducible protein DinB
LPETHLERVRRQAEGAADRALRTWSDGKLAETRTVDGQEVSLAWVLYHVVEHFAYHLGQIGQLISLRRRIQMPPA